MIDLTTLNPPQREAVLTLRGPLLVLAGAGSGKTRVIVHRIAHMLDQGIPPSSILAVTFTNKAALEMRERISGLVGPQLARPLTVSTFHAFGCELLRKYVDRLGYPKKFAIADAGDQMAIVKRLLKASDVSEKSLDNQKLLTRISLEKCESGRIHIPTDDLPPEKRPTVHVSLKFSRPLRAKAFEKLGATSEDISELLNRTVDAETVLARRMLPRYQRALRAQGMVDFDDLILLPIELLTTQADLREKLCRRFQYLLVDEYQDTNKSQLNLLKLLAGTSQNICAVGDDDQSIYSWRGADPESILAFDRHFQGVREIRLEQNYRSKGAILEASNAVIAKNEARKSKRLWTHQNAGEKLRVVTLEDEHEEGAFIATQIRRLMDDNVKPKDIAVLYRTNIQSRPIEEQLRLLEIPYEIIGGQSFFDRKEIKDLLAYLKLCANPSDDVAFLRIVNTPPRGIGEATIEAFTQAARDEHLTLTLTLQRLTQISTLSDGAKAKLQDFGELIERYRHELTQGDESLDVVVARLVEEISLKQMARASVQSIRAGQNKVHTIEAFIESVKAYAERTSANPPSLHGLVSKFALDGIDDDAGLSGDKVHLMTLHASKGLEWPSVFMCGLEEGLLPHEGMNQEPPNLPEERRLCYVGMTRAKERLFLTKAKRRNHRGKTWDMAPSRYLDDLPPHLLEMLEPHVELATFKRDKDAEAKSFFSSLAAKIRENKS